MNEALMAMKDEILEAVALAISAVRREQAAALKAITDASTAAHNLLREENTTLRDLAKGLEQQLEHAHTFGRALDSRLVEVKEDVQALPQLILDAKDEVQKSVNVLTEAVASKANDTDVQAVWDTLTEYARLEEMSASFAALATKTDVEAGLGEVRSTSGNIIGEVLSLSNQLNTMAVDIHAAIESNVEMLKGADDNLRLYTASCVQSIEDRMTDSAVVLGAQLTRIETDSATKEDFTQLQLGLQDELQKHQEAVAEALGPMASLNDLERVRTDVVELVSSRVDHEELVEVVASLALHADLEHVRADLAEVTKAQITQDDIIAAVAPFARQDDLDIAQSELATLVTSKNERLHDVLNETVARLVTKADMVEVQERLEVEVKARVLPETLNKVLQSFVSKEDFEETVMSTRDLIEERATPAAITRAVAPLALRADLEQARADLAVMIEARATPESVAAAVAPLASTTLLDQVRKELREELTEHPKARDIGVLIEPFVQRAELEEVRALAESKASPEDYDALVGRVRSKIIERYTATEDWLRGGAGYQAFALCRHNGATWQSLRDTKGEPGVSDDWMLQVDGVRSAGAESVDGALAFVTRMASGAVFTHPIKEPVPVFRGVYSPDEQYKAWDSVAKDSHVFLCLWNNPTGAPGEVQGEWQMFSGPRGKTGKPANEKAIADNVVRTLVPQLQAVVDSNA